MVTACLLHDIAYCQELSTPEQQKNHGRLSAQIARPFLTEIGLPIDRVNNICYGIAIHVDDVADLEGQRTAFAETISDADNIDRFDAYRWLAVFMTDVVNPKSTSCYRDAFLTIFNLRQTQSSTSTSISSSSSFVMPNSLMISSCVMLSLGS